MRTFAVICLGIWIALPARADLLGTSWESGGCRNGNRGNSGNDHLRLLFSGGELPRKYLEKGPTYEEIVNGVNVSDHRSALIDDDAVSQSYQATPEYQRLMIQHRKNMLYMDVGLNLLDAMTQPDAAGKTRLDHLTSSVASLPFNLLTGLLTPFTSGKAPERKFEEPSPAEAPVRRSLDKPREFPEEWDD